MNKRGQTIQVKIGDPIPYEEVKPLRNRQQLIEYLYEKTMELSQIPSPANAPINFNSN